METCSVLQFNRQGTISVLYLFPKCLSTSTGVLNVPMGVIVVFMALK